jgi:putative oxygen-independent coproporphyrinogen III oxidase
VSSEGKAGDRVPLGIYLHSPFCVSHCTYCDFYTRAFTGDTQLQRYASALSEGIKLSAADLGVSGWEVDTLYFGGGTPSLMTGEQLERILASLRSTFRLDPQSEISLEANPESLTRERLEGFRSLGVNRLSLGVQSFDDAILGTLGRAHSARQAREAFFLAREAGLDNVSLDLMLALPGQSAEVLEADLLAVGELAPDHLSTYLLEMDKETALRARIEKGELKPPTQDEAGELYQRTRALMEERGYVQYELSNFSLPGKECRHNLKYWTDRPFVGFGPSAWSYLARRRFRETPDLEGYLDAISRGTPPRREESPGGIQERLDEAIFAGLRLMEGVDLERLGREYGVIDPLGSRRQAIDDLSQAGLVSLLGSRLRLTPRGFPIANEVFEVFV